MLSDEFPAWCEAIGQFNLLAFDGEEYIAYERVLAGLELVGQHDA